MFCPQCGQQQLSDEVRFCKRCGFALGPVTELVKGGPTTAARLAVVEGHALTPSQRGTRKGLLIMSGGLLFGLLALLLTAMKEDLFVFIPVAVLIFTVGVMRLLYGLMLEDDSTRAKRKAAPATHPPGPATLEGADARAPELPPAHSIPAAAYAPAERPDTARMSAAPSVTEGTTRLLEDEGK